MGLLGIPTLDPDQSNTADDEPPLSAPDLLIPDSEAPPGFDRQPTPESSSFTDALDESAFDTASADIATQGYWKGPAQTDPEWVLVSTAIVADTPIPRTEIETAAQQSYDEYVTAYDAETSPLIDFEQAHTASNSVSEWRVDIHETSFTDDTPRHIYTDIMRQQYVENAVLGTIAFGPTDTGPPIDSLLDQYATLQRSRYETYRAAP